MSYVFPWQKIEQPNEGWIRKTNKKEVLAMIDLYVSLANESIFYVLHLYYKPNFYARQFSNLKEAIDFSDDNLIKDGFKLLDEKYQTLI